MPEIRYPPEPEEGQSRVEWERELLNPWRNDLKRRLLAERGRTCERCATRPAWDLDEGIIPRADMRGLSLEQRRLAFGEVNLFLLCGHCNRESAHDRDGTWARACARYGEDVVRGWYAGLGLRAPRREWIEEEGG